MKHYVQLMLLAVLVTPAAHAQQYMTLPEGGPTLPLSLHANRDLQRLIASRVIQQEARLSTRTAKVWAEDDWQNQSRIEVDYEDAENTVVWSFTWDGSGWVSSERTHYTFENDRITSEEISQWTGTDWEPVDLTTYSYTNGLIAEMLEQNWDAGAWVNDERTTYSYDGTTISGGQTGVWTGEDWEESERFTLTQEGNGFVQTYENWTGEAWENAERTTYANMTIMEWYEYLNGVMSTVLIGLTENPTMYDLLVGFQLPDMTVETWDGSEWVMESQQVTEYDNADRPLFITTTSWDEGEETAYRWAFTYEGANLASISWQTLVDPETWMDAFIETYVYNNDGTLQQATQQQPDQLGGGDLENALQVDYTWEGTGTPVEDEPLPHAYALDPAHPNPFNPATHLTYRLADAGPVAIRVFDMLGRHVATLFDGMQAAGAHEVTFEAGTLASGLYLIRLEAPGFQQTRMVTLLK